MNKILLVYEDYADLMSVEATLKRVGFDVIGLTSEYAMSDQMLSFNPDLVVGAGRSAKVSSLGVGKRLKENARWHGKSILIFQANFKPGPQDLLKIRVDMILESPVPPLRLIQVIGKMLGHDENALLERLNKAMHVESPHKPGAPGAHAGTSPTGKPVPEGEAIYVKGTVEEKSESTNSEELPFENTELKPSSEDQDFLLNNEEDKEKPSFKFGDRMSEAQKDDGSANGELAEAFPDVDLQSLEKELLGGGTPEVEKVEVVSSEPAPEINEATEAFTSAPQSEEELLQVKAREDLEKAEQKLKNRMAKYNAIKDPPPGAPNSTVTRVEARRRQKTLEAGWDQQNLNDIDKLRREFTKALFKK